MLQLARASTSRLAITGKVGLRAYATVSPSIISNPTPPPQPRSSIPSALDRQILHAVKAKTTTSLSTLIQHYVDNTGNVLPHSLPYESRPSADRRVNTQDDRSSNIVLLAHCIQDGPDHIITVSSGFALSNALETDETLVVSCAHTFEEVRGYCQL
jgi:hypothetical protein